MESSLLYREGQNKLYMRTCSQLGKCTLCDYFCMIGAEMDNHMRMSHSEEFEKIGKLMYVTKE